MSTVARFGPVVTLVGGVLLAIAGIIALIPGQVPLPWFQGLAWLVLGVGVALMVLPLVAKGESLAADSAGAAEREQING